MKADYKVRAYIPTVKGCGATDMGWDESRCTDFENFLAKETNDGWLLHSYEYRTLTTKGCGGGTGAWLVCVFERKV
jgi:hypothetical protein